MIKFLAITKTWRDKLNGNTYFSARVYDNNQNIIIKVPFQYGYVSQSESEIKKLLSNKTFFSIVPDTNVSVTKNFDVVFEKIENCKKKEVVNWG